MEINESNYNHFQSLNPIQQKAIQDLMTLKYLRGYSFLNNVLVDNNSTFLSSLNINGSTTLNNNTTLLSSLNVSGFTTLNNIQI